MVPRACGSLVCLSDDAQYLVVGCSNVRCSNSRRGAFVFKVTRAMCIFYSLAGLHPPLSMSPLGGTQKQRSVGLIDPQAALALVNTTKAVRTASTAEVELYRWVGCKHAPLVSLT